MTVEFTNWTRAEGGRIAAEMQARARGGDCDGFAVYVMPATRDAWARLVLARSCPIGAIQTLFFRFHGAGITSNVAAIPYRDLPALIADACASLPVYPIADAPAP